MCYNLLWFSTYFYSYIYWSECGAWPKIEKSQLDGSGRQVIVSKGLVWPTGIAIDRPAKRIYWADPKAMKVESVNLEGRHRHLVKAFTPGEAFRIFLLHIIIYYLFTKQTCIQLHEILHPGLEHGHIVWQRSTLPRHCWATWMWCKFPGFSKIN